MASPCLQDPGADPGGERRHHPAGHPPPEGGRTDNRAVGQCGFHPPHGGGRTVEPDFSGKELCDGCGVLDPLLVPGKLLLSGEYARLVKEITKLSGFAEQEDEVKN